jgi:hypothetical protein
MTREQSPRPPRARRVPSTDRRRSVAVGRLPTSHDSTRTLHTATTRPRKSKPPVSPHRWTVRTYKKTTWEYPSFTTVRTTEHISDARTFRPPRAAARRGRSARQISSFVRFHDRRRPTTRGRDSRATKKRGRRDSRARTRSSSARAKKPAREGANRSNSIESRENLIESNLS